MLLRFVILAVIIGLAAAIVPGIDVHGGFLALLWIAVIFALVNLVLAPLFHLISLPLIILTLGLFLLIVNTALLAITAWLTSHLDIDGFWSAFAGALIISLFSWLVELLVVIRPRRDEHRAHRRAQVA